jgi:hypothetical protein
VTGAVSQSGGLDPLPATIQIPARSESVIQRCGKSRVRWQQGHVHNRGRAQSVLSDNISSMTFAIKADVRDLRARTFTFSAQKTMYGGKRIATGDAIFVFASENEGGPGLIASGVVTSANALPKKSGIARQTPRVNITVRRTAFAKRRLGRDELKPFVDWNDGRTETELNFKFYRQATNKIVGISDEAAAYLRGFFPRD